MDIKRFKILEFLKDAGEGVDENISPILLNLFPEIDTNDGLIVRQYVGVVERVLQLMKRDGHILVSNYTPLGSGNESNGYTWIDSVKILASITHGGLEALEKESSKGSESRLHESIMASNQSNIETNLSVQEVNKATKNLYEKILPDNFDAQKKSSGWSLFLAGLSVVFIGFTAYLQLTDKTAQKIQSLKKEIQGTTKSLNELKISLDKINFSISTIRDSINKK